MNRLMIGAFLLCVAAGCGGGGGGGASQSPGGIVPTPAPGVTASASATVTPSPSPGASTQAGVVVGVFPQTATVSGQGALAVGATVAFPATSSGAGSIVLSLTASPVGTTPVAQSVKRVRASIGGTIIPVAYLALTPSATVAFGSIPALTFTSSAFNSGSSVTYYLGAFDPSNPAVGWTALSGPVTSTAGGVVSFASIAQTLALNSGTSYTFALFSSAQLFVPNQTTQTFAGGASVGINLGPSFGLPAAARSAVVAFAPTLGPGSTPAPTIRTVVPFPASCSGATTCPLTFSAPVGSTLLSVLLFAAPDGTGPALAYGTTAIAIPANQKTTALITLFGIMSSYTITLNPSQATTGMKFTPTYVVNAFDAAGEAIPNAVNTNFASPSYSVVVNDASAYSGQALYSGLGAGPETVSVQAAGYPAASATLSLTPAPSFTPGYATMVQTAATVAVPVLCKISVFARNTQFASHDYQLPCPAAFRHGRFDRNGTLWGTGPVGINPDGTSAGPLVTTAPLLAFDTLANSYFADTATNAIDIYKGAIFIRQIATPARPIGAAADANGNLYVSFSTTPGSGLGVYEYAANGVTPIASNASAGGTPQVDAAGNVYAVVLPGGVPSIAKWTVGTFGSAVPATTIPMNPAGAIVDFGVEPNGDIYAIAGIPNLPSVVSISFAAAGASSFTSAPQALGNLDGLGTNFIAVPIQ